MSKRITGALVPGVPAWKQEAIAALPYGSFLASTMAALLILELPDDMGEDWPTHDPHTLARAAFAEGQAWVARCRNGKAD